MLVIYLPRCFPCDLYLCSKSAHYIMDIIIIINDGLLVLM